MAEPNTKRAPWNSQLKGPKKKVGWSTKCKPPESGSSSGSGSGSTNGVPCGACKFLRRRCVNGCIFAPHFSPEQGTSLFAAVHKVFGASNVSKLLMQLPVHHRRNAVETICYEAQARVSDPVCGCVSVIISLQQKVAALKMELAMVQNQVMNSSVTVASIHQGSLQQPDQLYSNGSSVSNNNMINMNMFDSNLHNIETDHHSDVPSPIFDPMQFTGPFYKIGDVEEETGDKLVYGDQMF